MVNGRGVCCNSIFICYCFIVELIFFSRYGMGNLGINILIFGIDLNVEVREILRLIDLKIFIFWI